MTCPVCGKEAYADFVDNGFGPFAVQAGPFNCECGWNEGGCGQKSRENCAKCTSERICGNSFDDEEDILSILKSEAIP